MMKARATTVAALVGATLFSISFAANAGDRCLTKYAGDLRRAAFAEPATDDGAQATLRYLDVLNRLATVVEPPREACYERIADDAESLEGRYCPHHGEACSMLERIVRGVGRLRAEELVKRADFDELSMEARRSLYARAGKRYWTLWHKYGGARCVDGEASCARMEEVVWNAARAFAAAGRSAQSLGAYRALIDPSYQLHTTEVAKRAVYEVALHYERVADFDEAARWHERFAEESPKLWKAPDALRRAALLRLWLGDERGAEKLRKLHVKRYGLSERGEAAVLAMHFAEHHLDRGRLAQADKMLNATTLRLLVTYARLDERVHGFALKARVMRLRGHPHASRARERLLHDWPPARSAHLARGVRSRGGPVNGPRRVAAVLSDVGEVLFDEAEVVRKEAAAIRSSSRNWLERRREAMDRAEKAYLRILKLRPSPPPKWVVRAGASVAAMWAELDEELERTPQLRTLRFERLTLSAHERCALYAEKYQVWPEGAQRCHAWLSARYPRRHPALIELMPTLGGPVARIRTQPLR